MKRFLGILYLSFVLPACMQEAYAALPLTVSSAEQYMRVGGASGWSRQWTTPTSSGTSGLVLDDPSDATYSGVTDVHLFTWGTSIRVSCNTNAAVYAWVQDIDDITIATTGYITDTDTLFNSVAAPDGANGTFRVESGTYVDETCWRETFKYRTTRRPGARYGYCTGNATTLNWPCDDNDDCGGGGTCNTSVTSTAGGDPVDQQKGCFLQSLSATTAADCFLTEVR